MDDRRLLRRDLRARRDALTAAERDTAGAAVGDRLGAALRSAGLSADPGAVLGAFCAIGGELDVLPFAIAWARAGLASGSTAVTAPPTIALPRIDPDRPGHMVFLAWRPGQPLVPNRWGIPEPVADSGPPIAASAMRVVLVPAVAVDPSGHRLGMGAGYYDRWLAPARPGVERRPPDPLLVAVVHDFQVVDHLDAQPWDIGVHLVVTPTRVLYCRP